MPEVVQFTLNGTPASVTVEPDRKLLWVLRTELELTGTKYGCGKGFCGACTVLLDEQPVRSCQVAMSEVAGKAVVTVEGLARAGELHPVQQAFIDHDALQCGFCTPGMIMNVVGLLKRNPRPTRAEIVDAMEDNLCRCGAHKRIVAAIEACSGETGQEA